MTDLRSPAHRSIAVRVLAVVAATGLASTASAVRVVELPSCSTARRTAPLDGHVHVHGGQGLAGGVIAPAGGVIYTPRGRFVVPGLAPVGREIRVVEDVPGTIVVSPLGPGFADARPERFAPRPTVETGPVAGRRVVVDRFGRVGTIGSGGGVRPGHGSIGHGSIRHGNRIMGPAEARRVHGVRPGGRGGHVPPRNAPAPAPHGRCGGR